MHGDQDRKTSHGNADSEDGEEESVARLVRDEGDNHRENKRHSPWRDAVQLGLDAVVAVRLNNARREVGVAISGHNQAEVHEASDNDLIIFEDVADILEGCAALHGGTPLIGAEAGRDKRLFAVGEPLDLFGEVGKPKVEEEADNDGQQAFEDEDPAPSSVAADATHLSDRCSEETAEGSCESGAVEEERVSPLRLVAPVPHADEVEGARKHARLEDSQKEPGGAESSVVCYEALEHGDETKSKHVDAQPNVRLELLQEDVGGNLQEYVGHEEDDKRIVVEGAIQVQFRAEAEDVRIGDVHSVCESKWRLALELRSWPGARVGKVSFLPRKASRYMTQRKGMTLMS